MAVCRLLHRPRGSGNLHGVIFRRTDLRIGVSEAKFDAESDFEVGLAVAPQKPSQNSEKLIFRPKRKSIFCLLARKNSMLGIV